MKLTDNGWIIVDAVKVSNDGQSTILGDVIMPTILRPSDLAESTLPPKTVSIYKLPNFIDVQQRAGLPVNPHLVFLHQLLSTPLKLVGLALLAPALPSPLFHGKQRNKADFGRGRFRFRNLFSIQFCLPAWQFCKTSAFAGGMGACGDDLFAERVSSC